MRNAYSRTQHNVFTSAICSGDLQLTSSNLGLATTATKQRARDIATFKRFLLNKNSMLRGRYSPLDVVIDTSTASASCP